jgi:hypothetical protein
VIPSTFTLTGATTRTYDDGVRALILTGEQHFTYKRVRNRKVTTENGTKPVSVTVFLGRDNTWAEAITRALTEGEGE